ncbi:hypothetical protein F5Y13DRAFT_192062 [Hypoxylon sp. FL1857]|nr:hypothetical protein F5Y13DRAFT_192062 [Hypoxylon sp. FL1857]
MSLPLDQIGSLPPAKQQAILNGPALEPPDNVTPNFTNPPNRNGLGCAAVTICLVASSLGILIRVYGRFFCVRKVFIEDYLAIAAFGLFVGYIYTTYWYLNVIGFFVHQWDIRVRDFTTLLYIIHVGSNCYAVTMLIMKASILREWSRIFVPHGTRNAFFWTCHIVMSVNIAFYAAIVIAENLSCFPYRRIWDKTVPGSTCIDTKATAVAASAINIVLDIITLILPQRIIWRLQMPIKQKIGVSLVFMIGVLACVSAIARLAYSTQYYTSADTSYTLSALSLWAIAEMACMFLIFGGTAAPKVFTSVNLISKLVNTLKSWSTLSLRTSGNGSGSSWTQTKPQEPNPRKVYQKIDDNGVPLTNLLSASASSESRERFQDARNTQAGIICTKQFTAREEYIEDHNAGGQKPDNQPLWEGRFHQGVEISTDKV